MNQAVTEPVLSIIVPTYNASGKIGRALDSIASFGALGIEHEVIFVDDSSTDDTREVIGSRLGANPGWRLIALDRNSGSPSRPRNIGVSGARGRYVYFHDADDELLPQGVAELVRAAVEANADVARGWIQVKDDLGKLLEANRIPSKDRRGSASQAERVRDFFAHQSTTAPSLIRTSLLHSHGLRWDESVRMGEDTLFLADVLSRAQAAIYVDVPTFVYDRRVQGELTSTQSYTEKALQDHLLVWTRVSEVLKRSGVDYVGIRGTIAVREALLSLYARRTGPVSEETYEDLREFIRHHDSRIDSDSYKGRVRELYRTVRDGDYRAFERAIKPRLLIAGYDLKFILGAIPALAERFEVAVDEWSGHETHDTERSSRLLAWADVVFCDWLLGNAAWYARKVRPDQPLVVRAHRFELERDYGFDPALARVDRFYSVSVKTLEDFIRTFDLPREKSRLLPNWVDVRAYKQYPHGEKARRLALVGAVPDRKGMLRALQVLARLHAHDPAYTLEVYGKTARELEWIWNDPGQRAYFRECERFIEFHGLGDAVHYHGWADMRSEIGKNGWVLSTSDDESFHLAPAEALAAGSRGLVLEWPGSRYVFPASAVFSSVDEIVEEVLKDESRTRYMAAANRGREYVVANYDVARFAERLGRDISRLIMMRSTR